MTLVEFFSGAPLENAAGFLSLRPDKVIYVGSGRRMRESAAFYAALAKRLGADIAFETRPVVNGSLAGICASLTEIVETEEDCVFDLTGGSERSLVAMGAVFDRYKGKKGLQMVRFDVSTGRIADCDNDGCLPAADRALPFSGRDCVALHGGKVTQCTRLSDLKEWEDVSLCWELCRSVPHLWNSGINALTSLISASSQVEGGLRACIEKGADVPGASDAQELLHRLSACGLVTDTEETAKGLSFTYKSAAVKRCLMKAGNVLELKALLVASSARGRDGKRLYGDCASGVVIDWDGRTEGAFTGTVNEIDLLLMRGFVPVFVSCKNGAVDDTELYKLYSVANAFGGRYARKVLLATRLQKTAAAKSYFLQRAADMGIRVIDGIDEMDGKTFALALSKA